LVSRENYRTNAGGTTLMSQAKLSAILCLFTYILEILRKGDKIENYRDFHVLLKCSNYNIYGSFGKCR